MLRLGTDWVFEVDRNQSKVWLTPKGVWGIKVYCPRTKVDTSDGFGAEFAPTLTISNLAFDGQDWRDFIGMEVRQSGAWRGDDEPEASLFVVQTGELYETSLRVVAHEDTALRIELEAIADIFFDDGHDTDVPLKLEACIPFEGVRFRFRADGLDSRYPERRAGELLSSHLTRDAFGDPELTKLQPGVFEAYFPPTVQSSVSEKNSPEENFLQQSAKELVEAFVKQGWLELENDGLTKLVPDFVQEMEQGGHGSGRASRIAEWLMEREEVVDLHCTDEDLGVVLDKWW